MYLRCLLGTHFLKGCVLKKVDNAADNQPVTKRYNDFLDSLEEDCWVVLCHEDWEVKERLYDVVKMHLASDWECVFGYEELMDLIKERVGRYYNE